MIDYLADVMSATDYYPFGMVMPGRQYTSSGGDYRFGYQGSEKNGEIAEGYADEALTNLKNVIDLNDAKNLIENVVENKVVQSVGGIVADATKETISFSTSESVSNITKGLMSEFEVRLKEHGFIYTFDSNMEIETITNAEGQIFKLDLDTGYYNLCTSCGSE